MLTSCISLPFYRLGFLPERVELIEGKSLPRTARLADAVLYVSKATAEFTVSPVQRTFRLYMIVSA